MATISIVLADDNASVLADLHEELEDKFRIVGTAANGDEAIREVLRLDPDVVVLDITMPVLTGLQVASRLQQAHPRTKVLFLTIHEEPEYISADFSAGALGYVTKRRLYSDLPRAIRDVFEGRKFLSPFLKRIICDTNGNVRISIDVDESSSHHQSHVEIGGVRRL